MPHDPPPYDPDYDDIPPPRRKRRTWIWVVLIVGVLGVGGAGWLAVSLFQGASDMKPLVDDVARMLSDGRVDDLREIATPELLRNLDIGDGIDAVVESMKETHGAFEEIESTTGFRAGSSTGSPSYRKIDVKLRYTKGISVARFLFHEIDGTWKLHSFNIANPKP
ncbi:MAG: hypothetical protein CMJ83_15005 [Planctomycetes bacterium]|nr:hypothetical protein [Planctomycetota bacterium]